MNEKIKLYKRYGVLLDKIIERGNLGRKSKESLHIALKTSQNIISLTHLTKKELYEYILEIEVFFASEYGWELMTDENETLTEYLKKENL